MEFRDMQEQGTFHAGREFEREILNKRIEELEAVCRNALTSLAIINMPVQGNPANVATDKELMDIMAESFKQALKGN